MRTDRLLSQEEVQISLSGKDVSFVTLMLMDSVSITINSREYHYCGLIVKYRTVILSFYLAKAVQNDFITTFSIIGTYDTVKMFLYYQVNACIIVV